jgi:tetratricopeptide (TPR) repeat protein
MKGLALARLGRLDELRAWTDEMLLAAERSGDRGLATAAHLTQAFEALARGRIDDARLATAQMLIALPGEAPYRVSHAMVTMASLLATGDADAARTIADALNANPAFDLAHLVGAVAVAQGDLDTARSVLDAWHAAGQRLPADSNLSGKIWGLAECAHGIGDRDAAALLYDQLLPYDGQLVVASISFIPASAAFTLGLLAQTLDQPGRAIKHYNDAFALEEQCGADALSARTSDGLARLT